MATEQTEQDPSRLLPPVLRPGWRALGALNNALDRLFGPRLNPVYHLGAIGYFFFWILLGTGIYLYLFYDMSPQGAYKSVQDISEGQRWFGGIIRSLHRYVSAAFALTVVMHMLQAFFSDRFRKHRWFAWFSGAVILPFMWFEGATGYVMVWDERGLMAATHFAKWFDVFPLAVEPFSRNFVPGGSLNSLFFFLLSYLHILFPCAMIILLWVHNMRISRPPIVPPRPLMWGIMSWLIAVSVVYPAASGEPADMARLAGQVNIDWFYLAVFPFAHAFAVSAPAMWGLVGCALGFVAVLPWTVRDPNPSKKRPPVKLHLEHCTGCELCQKACPFEAINIVKRTDGRPFEWQVEIVDKRCASCGLCIPACPFPALTMGEWSLEYFDRRLKSLLRERGKTMVFSCERSKVDLGAATKDHRFAFLIVPCVGIVGPKAVTTATECGAKGIAVFECSPLNCHYRITRSRLDSLRGELGVLHGLRVFDGPMEDPAAVKKLLEGFREGA